jgi:hypothetical protein
MLGLYPNGKNCADRLSAAIEGFVPSYRNPVK